MAYISNICAILDLTKKKEKQEIALKAFTSDYFLGSVNAMSEDGVFINIDGNGSDDRGITQRT